MIGQAAPVPVAWEDSCPDVPGWASVGWDPQVGATGYGTFSALLAGFAISGLLWIAATDRAQLNRRAVAGLLASIVPLAIATLLYAEVGAETVCDRAVMEIPLPSLLLTIGAVTLFASLIDLLSNDLEDPEQNLGNVVRWLVIVFGTGGVFSANVSLLRSFSDSGDARLAVWVTQGLILGIALGGCALLTHHERWSGRFMAPRLAMAYSVLAITALGYFTMYAIAFLDYPDWAPGWLSWARVVVWVIFLAIATRNTNPDPPVVPPPQQKPTEAVLDQN